MTRTATPSISETADFEGDGPLWPRALRRFASEPFVHFALLGALVFAGHRYFAVRDAGAKEPPVEVSATKQRELARLFEQRQHRSPTDEERRALVQRYVEDEVLFREGLRLSLVNTDPMLRAQLVARVRGMLQAEVDEAAPSDADVARYFEAHRADYVVPESVTYREYFFRRGPDAIDDSRRLLARLAHGEDAPANANDPVPSDYPERSMEQLAALLGPEAAHDLWTLPLGTWRALHSSHGVHLVRVSEHAAPSAPPFSDIRARVTADYRRDRTARAFQTELARLTAAARVHVEQP